MAEGQSRLLLVQPGFEPAGFFRNERRHRLSNLGKMALSVGLPNYSDQMNRYGTTTIRASNRKSATTPRAALLAWNASLASSAAQVIEEALLFELGEFQRNWALLSRVWA
jgi:hypothetical protein